MRQATFFAIFMVGIVLLAATSGWRTALAWCLIFIGLEAEIGEMIVENMRRWRR